MTDFLNWLMAGVRLAIFIGSSAAIFTIAVISVCRWLKWAPINITVNVNNDGSEVTRADRAPAKKVCLYSDGCPMDGPVCHLCAHVQLGGAK